jgi:hypothetical protein
MKDRLVSLEVHATRGDSTNIGLDKKSITRSLLHLDGVDTRFAHSGII